MLTSHLSPVFQRDKAPADRAEDGGADPKWRKDPVDSEGMAAALQRAPVPASGWQGDTEWPMLSSATSLLRGDVLAWVMGELMT